MALQELAGTRPLTSWLGAFGARDGLPMDSLVFEKHVVHGRAQTRRPLHFIDVWRTGNRSISIGSKGEAKLLPLK